MTVKLSITLEEQQDRRISFVIEGSTSRDTSAELKVGNYIRDLIIKAGDAINDNNGHLPDLELVVKEQTPKAVKLPEFTLRRWLYANLLGIPVYIFSALLPPQNPDLLNDLLKFVLTFNTFVIWFMVAWAWEDTLNKIAPRRLYRSLRTWAKRRKEKQREQAVDDIIDGVLNNTKDRQDK